MSTALSDLVCHIGYRDHSRHEQDHHREAVWLPLLEEAWNHREVDGQFVAMPFAADESSASSRRRRRRLRRRRHHRRRPSRLLPRHPLVPSVPLVTVASCVSTCDDDDDDDTGHHDGDDNDDGGDDDSAPLTVFDDDGDDDNVVVDDLPLSTAFDEE